MYAAYDHVWVPGKWRTSLYGGYIAVDYNENATALISGDLRTMLARGRRIRRSGSDQRRGTSPTGDDPDLAIGYVGSRTQYNFTPDFYAGIDVIYTKLNTGFNGIGVFTARAGTARPTGIYTIEDQDNLAVTVRFHRDFRP